MNIIQQLDLALKMAEDLNKSIDKWGKSLDEAFIKLISERQIEIDKWKSERNK